MSWINSLLYKKAFWVTSGCLVFMVLLFFARQHPSRYELMGTANGIEVFDLKTGDLYYHDTIQWFRIGIDKKMVPVSGLPE
jgi:hypothetical protein